MTGSPSPTLGRRFAQRAMAAAALGAVHRAGRGTRPPTSGLRSALAGALALAGPAAVVGPRLAGGTVSYRSPGSWSGRLILGGYLSAGVLVEELLWRGPLATGRARTVRAALSGAGFAAIHVRRDGRSSAPAHLVLAAAWTTSVLIGRQLRWAVLSHLGYNCLAVCLHSVQPAPASSGIR